MLDVGRTTPGRTRNHEKRSQQEEMSLAPDSCRCDEEPSCHPDTAQMVGGQESRVLKGPLEHDGEGDRIRGEER